VLDVPTTVVPRFHAYVNAALGDHVPGTAVSTEPTRATPDTVGAGEVTNTPYPTAADTAETLDTDVYPAAEPVTVTVRAEPRSRDVGVYVLAVPTVVVPRFHTYDNEALGGHVPGTAVRTEPTRATPEIVGTGDVAKMP
jgi:hypothetical protein